MNFDESKFNLEQVVGLGPQLPLPPNQLPLSPRVLLSHDCVSHIKGRRLSRTFHHTRPPQPAQSRPMRLPKAHSLCCHNVTKLCGWRNGNGKKCGKPISYGDYPGHFATAHGITNKAWNVKVICFRAGKGDHTQKLSEARERDALVLCTLGQWILGVQASCRSWLTKSLLFLNAFFPFGLVCCWIFLTLEQWVGKLKISSVL